MLKINIRPKILYIITIVIFVAIICFFTAIYPRTVDEFRFSHDTWSLTFQQVKLTFLTDSPRFLNLINIIFLHFYKCWKIIFTILNPFIQLFIIFGMFFVATGRKIDFKTKKDFYPFLLLVLLYLLFSPKPSHIIFWMTGAMNYSWAFVPPLILLCLLRQTIDGKKLKSSALKNFLILFIGFASGMSNENTGPMMLGIIALFFIYCKYKKIKIPQFYYFALVGVILGIGTMFGSGAGKERLTDDRLYEAWLRQSLTQKIFVFIAHFNKFLNAMLWIPIINITSLLIILYDKKGLMLKNKQFILSSILCVCGFILTLVLFMAPFINLRAHYSSAIFLYISFIMLLFIIKEIYSINLTKYLSLILLIVGIVFAPLIAIPHITLHRSDVYREKTIKQAVEQGKKIVMVNRLTVLKAPTENWTIEYYEFLWPYYAVKLTHDYGIILNYEIPQKFSFYTKPI